MISIFLPTMRALLLTTATLAFLSLPSHAQKPPPSDADLRGFYCISVLEKRVARQRANLAAQPDEKAREIITKAADRSSTDLHRLQSYYTPSRMGYFDSNALSAAKNRGALDYETTKRHEDACYKGAPPETFGSTAKDFERWEASYTKCLNSEPAVVRLAACDNVNWLPF